MGNDPTVQQLRVFRVVAEELHFGRAAERLIMSQPPLTRHIQGLEQAVGAKLLERSSRKVALTKAGAAFLAEATVALARLDRAGELARRIAEGHAGRISLGYVEPLAIELLPRVLMRFRESFPDVDLRLHELHTHEQIEALHSNAIDIAVLRAPANVDPDLEFAPLFADPLVAAVPPGHPAARAEIGLAELAGEDFIVYAREIGQGMITATLSGCAAAGFSPHIAHQAQSTPMLLTLVAAGEGVALVSSPIAQVPRPGVHFAALTGSPARSELMLAWRRGEDSPAMRRLSQLLLELGPENT
ncbi:LysR family transcriptional regulator [Sciscionella marina]|uniref:LysR family transcriptional regulator n=1 Tax=Sciscionella marina TaxID=508770 RepID=UPI00039E1E04|nr:LysR family transcriptional regulator [Sciscionella marina]